ncbi:hypothetical protein EJV46_03920 [Roseococcus sp. SYP-B2431]|uniref:hypothetical protein n=1 Tax=Roseococcus sp. SYP-B2431 TaxID=2496640 RepID=UPI001040B39F|nr:hypothetical protein [Roseococcus sp. SYP-B2431]TCH99826.1 hypothetical protein EJV46_03920 [Roseococcus sp. SYP-B2431]
MHRRPAFAALVLVAFATVAPARAQLATYCGGVIQAEAFGRQVIPGVQAAYSVTLRNAGGQARTLVLVVTAPFTDRPVPSPRSLAPGSRTTIGLGTQMLLGRSPLRDNELAETVRITCQ